MQDIITCMAKLSQLIGNDTSINSIKSSGGLNSFFFLNK
uniref:Uncharacterized protein n=1 Tax=Anguilla anguilla TaxID=7936 RepID=A0A0E9QXK6_ANGAN